MPERIQRKRTKGSKMPKGAIYVGRPGKYGNPWIIVRDGRWWRVQHITEDRRLGSFVVHEHARHTASRQYGSDLVNDRLPYTVDDVERELGGHDLSCWCPPSPLLPNGSRDWLGLQCHADVLLSLANPELDTAITELRNAAAKEDS